MWRTLLILISLVNASLIVQGGDPTEPSVDLPNEANKMGEEYSSEDITREDHSKGATNLQAMGIELNVQSNTVREGDSVLVEGRVWNQFSALDTGIWIVVQRWDGSSWDNVNKREYHYSFREDEKKTFTYIWRAEPGRYRFTVVVDPKNEVTENNELDNKISIDLNVTMWATIYGDVNINKVLGSGEKIFYSWTVPNDGTVIFYDVDAGNVDARRLQAISSVTEIKAADKFLETGENPDCILCRYDADEDGNIDNWHVFQVAERKINAPVFQVGGWYVGILWENKKASKSFTGVEPIVFITEVRDNRKCKYSKTGICDYVVEVPAPLKNQFGKRDEIRIQFIDNRVKMLKSNST